MDTIENNSNDTILPEIPLHILETYKTQLEKINPIMYNFNDKPLVEENKPYTNPYEQVIIPKKEKKVKKDKKKREKKEDLIDFTGFEHLCRDFMNNMCVRENCRFIHDPQFCQRFFKNKSCKYKAGCCKKHYIKKEILDEYYSNNPIVNKPILQSINKKLYTPIIEKAQTFQEQRNYNNSRNFNEPTRNYNQTTNPRNTQEYNQNSSRNYNQLPQRNYNQTYSRNNNQKNYVKPYDNFNNTDNYKSYNKQYDENFIQRQSERFLNNDININYQTPIQNSIQTNNVTNSLEYQMNQLKLENERLKEQLNLINK